MEKILSSQAAYRTASKQKVNQHILYTWQKVCELLANRDENVNEYNRQLLIDNLQNIKQLMFEKNPNNMINNLKEVFNNCGITFELVKHFTGAPVQGFIKKKENRMILCMTIRQSYADIFCFTLFHEIGHILNSDIEYNKIDYYVENEERENDADEFAKNILINKDDYNIYINKADFSKESIIEFSKVQKVRPYIVVGRLQKDKKIEYSQYSDLKVRYKYKQ